MKKKILLFCLIFLANLLRAEDGYRLWLRYDKIDDAALLQQYRSLISSVFFDEESPMLNAAKKELITGLSGLLGKKIGETNVFQPGSIFMFAAESPAKEKSRSREKAFKKIPASIPGYDYESLGEEGFIIRRISLEGKPAIFLTAKTEKGILYSVFHFLRLLQTRQPVSKFNITSRPKIQNRMLDHWDNLNRTVERGYAGISIWNWHQLPDYIDQRYIDYARANASIGINATVLTNVNANAHILTKEYLQKVKALADVFRPYNIKVFLTARFSAPLEIGGLKTADPLDEEVKNWWKKKADEIYHLVPDFGGFLVKANSEGQPGPQNYGRTHADGANMLADAVGSHKGIVIWRAFVYDVRPQKTSENFDSSKVDPNEPSIASADRFKQAYLEFKPLDGKFRNNVVIQVKNGPIDFQPREPFSPLFGAMPKTPLAMEFQLTQEYLGQGTHLVYQAPLFKEVLETDTYVNGKGSTVAKLIDGTLQHYSITTIAAVANIGSERNWTNHPFGQANWYSYGRLAWDHELSADQIAEEWIRQTFTNKKSTISEIKKIMMTSREAVVNYMTPLGLHHIMATGHHFGPGPWVSNLGRADWNPVYYHRADSIGIGFDRTAKGSNALSQYSAEVQKQFENVHTTDEKFLLWFHHVPWNFKMRSGKTLWLELCHKYNLGVDSVRWMKNTWSSIKNNIDKERWHQVDMYLKIQEKEAVWWRDACLVYFQTFSRTAIPSNHEQPAHSLEYYKALRFLFAPGNGGNN
jgi:alpha-glucuronidase